MTEKILILSKCYYGVSMGGTLSVILSDCFMNKIEIDIVFPLKPKFYPRFVSTGEEIKMSQMSYFQKWTLTIQT